MRYLKQYESTGSVLYHRIGVTEAKRSFQSRGGGDQFTTDEINKIDIIMKKNGFITNFNNAKHELSYVNSYRISIFKGRDEYYYILDEEFGISGCWYECDTIDGVLQCLESNT